MAKVIILGAGVMGSAMAAVASDRGHLVSLVGTHLDEAIIRSVAGTGLHPKLGVVLAPSVTPYPWDRLDEAMQGGADLLILGVSSAGVAWAIDRIAAVAKGTVPILMITKGLVPEGNTIAVLPRVVARELEARTGLSLPVMAVGGPCIAGELAAKRDTNVVITGDDTDLLNRIIDLLGTPYYHARPSTDVIGVEVCAAFKNFYAIGVGSANGRLERAGPATNGALMHNLAAGLFTQALAELSMLVACLGGDQSSVAGLAGAGDLYVTCQAGRNSRLGKLLGLGLNYSQAKAGHMTSDTIEGAELAISLGPTLDAMMASGILAEKPMPLTRAILDAICRDQPLDPSRQRVSRG